MGADRRRRRSTPSRSSASTRTSSAIAGCARPSPAASGSASGQRSSSNLPVAAAFGHPGKAAAIQAGWDERERIFAEYRAATDKIAFFEALPWIGKITALHLAKNTGISVSKPDRWLVRLADAENTTPAALCERLAAASGDRVGTVDVVLWRACSLGMCRRVLQGREHAHRTDQALVTTGLVAA